MRYATLMCEEIAHFSQRSSSGERAPAAKAAGAFIHLSSPTDLLHPPTVPSFAGDREPSGSEVGA